MYLLCTPAAEILLDSARRGRDLVPNSGELILQKKALRPSAEEKSSHFDDNNCVYILEE